MNTSPFNTMNYELRTMNYANKNKANSKPIKAKTKPISNVPWHKQPISNKEVRNFGTKGQYG